MGRRSARRAQRRPGGRRVWSLKHFTARLITAEAQSWLSFSKRSFSSWVLIETTWMIPSSLPPCFPPSTFTNLTPRDFASSTGSSSCCLIGQRMWFTLWDRTWSWESIIFSCLLHFLSLTCSPLSTFNEAAAADTLALRLVLYSQVYPSSPCSRHWCACFRGEHRQQCWQAI